jgi:preprotein translocase subunit SecF
MSKCKKNILIIFGYLLVMAISFLPCKQFTFNIDGKWTEGGNKIIFLPFYVNSEIKYIKKKKWLSEYQLKSLQLQSSIEHSKRFIEELDEANKNLIEQGIREKEEWSLYNQTLQLISNEMKKINKNKTALDDIRLEFVNKVGNDKFIYSQLMVEMITTEIALILFVAGFLYILFCEILSKSKKEGEKSEK